MTPSQSIKILREYNAWRHDVSKGLKGQPRYRTTTDAIDVAIEVMSNPKTMCVNCVHKKTCGMSGMGPTKCASFAPKKTKRGKK